MTTLPLDRLTGEERILLLSRVPSLLAAEERWDDLYSLARNDAYLATQAAFSQGQRLATNAASPLTTLDLSLQAAIAQNRAPEIAYLTLAYQRWSEQSLEESPLDALRAGKIQRAIDLADLCRIEVAIVWYLLLAWELHECGDDHEAQEILSRLRSLSLPEVQLRDESNLSALLPVLLDIDYESFSDLSRRLLGDQGREDICKALLAAEDRQAAFEVAQTIFDPRVRVRVLVSVVSNQVEAGETTEAHESLRLAQQALESLSDSSKRATSLSEIAAALARLHDEMAAELALRSALALIEAEEERTKVIHLRDLAIGLAGAGHFSRALEVANLIEGWSDWSYKHEALARISVEQARAGDFGDALTLLDKIETRLDEYPQTVRSVASLLAEAGEFGTALQTVQLLEPEKRESGLFAIATRQASAGFIEDAARTLEAVRDASLRARTLVSISRAFIESGRQEQGRAMLDSALAEAFQATGASERIATLATIVEAQAASGDTEGARATWRTAIESAEELDHEGGRRRLCAIAVRQAKAALRDIARESFVAARNTLRLTTDHEWLARSLWEIGQDQIEAGEFEAARNTIASALDVTPPKLGDWWLPFTLASIATSQAKYGDRNQARETIELAMAHTDLAQDEYAIIASKAILQSLIELEELDFAAQVAPMLPDGEAWDVMLKAAAQRAEAGDSLHASRLFEVTLKLVNQLDSWNRDDAVASVAEVQAQYMDANVALKTAELASTKTARAKAQVQIAIKLAKEEEFEYALVRANEIAPPDYKQEAFAKIAELYAAARNPDTAVAIFEKALESARRVDPDRAPWLFADIAEAEAKAGLGELARRTFAEALQGAGRIDVEIARGRTLVRIVDALVEAGELELAFNTAASIDLVWVDGQALATVFVHCLANGELALGDKALEVLSNPWWRAVAIGTKAAREERSGLDEAARQSRLQMFQLLETIPAGDSQDRLIEVLVEIQLEAGFIARAVQLAHQFISERNLRLPKVARSILARGDLEEFKRLIQPCARYRDAAFQICALLAEAYPGQASALVRELSESAS